MFRADETQAWLTDPGVVTPPHCIAFFFSHFSFRTTTALWCTAARWTTPSWSVSSLSSTAYPSGSSSWCSASPPPRRELSSSHTSSGLRRSVHRCFYQHRKAQLGSPTCGNVHFIMKGFRGISMLLCLLRCYHQEDTYCGPVMSHIWCYIKAFSQTFGL